MFSFLKKAEKKKLFRELKIRVLVIDGEENILELLTRKLARHGIVVKNFERGAEYDYDFSFWTRDNNPGVPIRWGVRLILRSKNPSPDNDRTGDVGDEIIRRPFYTADEFSDFVAQWIIERLKSLLQA